MVSLWSVVHAVVPSLPRSVLGLLLVIGVLLVKRHRGEPGHTRDTRAHNRA